ncbi:MAG: glycogen/starch/alpha-glucan phosphorylase [Spirochaetaceae bacterium]|nr:MAG: glycogen/starch/alpha-glucan phosphorylase [Spirochaetaceae bacterium]
MAQSKGKRVAEARHVWPREGHDHDSLAWGFAEHLKYSLGVDSYSSTQHDHYLSLAYTIRDRLIHQWIRTQQTHHMQKVKRAYYLSLEFLIGRSMGMNAINLRLDTALQQALESLGYSWDEIREEEVDAGLGNGGLGRLAACFMESLATLDLPAFGYGLRYDYGIFRQAIDHGYQVEHPDDWLRRGNPWEIERPDRAPEVHFGGRVELFSERGRLQAHWVDTETVIGIAYDMPVVGYGGSTVNTLRLWSARAPEEFGFSDFNLGDYMQAVRSKVNAENLTKVLYPNDRLYLGKELRLRQQYFFVACSLWDILRRFKAENLPWDKLPEMAAVQLNDTHPSLAVPELMRVLLDQEGLEWDSAWEITVATLAYTNHTLMPEALEKWPVAMLEALLPRHLQIIYEVNRRFLMRAAVCFPGDIARLQNVSVIEEGAEKQVRMANLAIIGSHSTNGVAELHTRLLQQRVVADFALIFPERFNNKTNGITQRRWLLKANPRLAQLISEAIGEGWITDFAQIEKLKPYAGDAAFLASFGRVKQQAKLDLARYLERLHGWELSSASLFDVQIKRIHQYKRQLLNALGIVVLYNRLRNGDDAAVPRTFLFGGKAAPGYDLAKLMIKFVNNLGAVINNDPVTRGRLKVFFLPNYRVSLAERIFPAADISEQISTAGTEASGTGNMKFMCNGALTLGTLDGANIEIAEQAGRENVFIFGLTADEVSAQRQSYNPWECYQRNPEIRQAIDLISSGFFNVNEPGIFDPLLQSLFQNGDFYMNLADLGPWVEAQEAVSRLYADQNAWNRKAVLNIAASGKFSSDRTIRQYAEEIWHVQPCRVETDVDPAATLQEAQRSNNR